MSDGQPDVFIQVKHDDLTPIYYRFQQQLIECFKLAGSGGENDVGHDHVTHLRARLCSLDGRVGERERHDGLGAAVVKLVLELGFGVEGRVRGDHGAGAERAVVGDDELRTVRQVHGNAVAA